MAVSLADVEATVTRLTLLSLLISGGPGAHRAGSLMGDLVDDMLLLARLDQSRSLGQASMRASVASRA